jgi:nucleotide-binding universal stress UspA family protein
MASFLLYLSGTARGQGVIELAVSLARRHEARLRGITIADSRRVRSIVATCESAHHAVAEQSRLHKVQQAQADAHVEFTRLCLDAGVDFDVRRVTGDPREVLRSESQWHDLIVAPFLEGESDTGASPGELIDLVRSASAPVFIPRRAGAVPQRILLIYDGTTGSSRLVRSFIRAPLFPVASCRLLAVGPTEEQSRELLRNMHDYCRTAKFDTESGWAVGSVRSVVTNYAAKWDADVVALGAPPGNPLIRRLLGDTAEDILQHTRCGLLIAG